MLNTLILSRVISRVILLVAVTALAACGGGGGGGGAPNTKPVVEITSLQADDQFNVRTPVVLQATASDAEDGNLASSVEWNSSRDGDLGKSRALSTLTEGFHTITAEVRDSGRSRITDTVSIRIVNDRPELEAGVADNRTEVIAGTTLTLQATASDTEDGDISSAVVWTSDLEGSLGTGASLEVSFTVVDAQFVTALVTDADGKSSNVEFEIDVLPLPDNLYIKASNTEGVGSSCVVDAIDPTDMSVGAGCDNFGFAVALSEDGSTLVVGAPFEDGVNNSLEDSGAVYVYRDDGTGTWVFEDSLRAPDAGLLDRFGSALSLNADGSVLAVTGFEAAYIYGYDGSLWSDGFRAATATSGFDASVALNSAGDVLAVGSPEEESVYLYKLAAEVATLDGVALNASNEDAGDRFGVAVALDSAGDTLVVGARQESSALANDEADNASGGAGAAYVFQRLAVLWSQQAYLKASVVQANSGFGAAVAINSDGTRVAIGAPQENISGDEPLLGDEGAAYVFAEVGGNWDLASRAQAANQDPGDQFGNAVALTADGLTLFAGARAEDSRGKNVDSSQTDDFIDPQSGTTDYNDADAGAVYAFDVSVLVGLQQTYYKAFNSAEGDKFGTSIAINDDGSVIAVGANLEDGSGQDVDADLDNVPGLQAGAVYLFR